MALVFLSALCCVFDDFKLNNSKGVAVHNPFYSSQGRGKYLALHIHSVERKHLVVGDRQQPVAIPSYQYVSAFFGFLNVDEECGARSVSHSAECVW